MTIFESLEACASLIIILKGMINLHLEVEDVCLWVVHMERKDKDYMILIVTNSLKVEM